MAYTKKARKFGRKRDEKKAFFRSLTRSLILHERIKTTEARAKSLRPFVEKLVTKAGKDGLSVRRSLLSVLGNDKKIVDKLIKEIAPKYKDRPGGYLRITKIEQKQGDDRKIAVIEFV